MSNDTHTVCPRATLFGMVRQVEDVRVSRVQLQPRALSYGDGVPACQECLGTRDAIYNGTGNSAHYRLAYADFRSGAWTVAPCGGEKVTLTPVQRRIIDYALINVEIFGN